MLGCNKTDVSRWENNPCSTHVSVTDKKRKVVKKTMDLLELGEKKAEQLISRAGLTLEKEGSSIKDAIVSYDGHIGAFAAKSQISERMLQYYKNGKIPTKQVILAMAITLEYTVEEIQWLLRNNGFCLSKSLPNDVVVLWGLQELPRDGLFLYRINEILEDLELPMLMTKQ
ncbi:MAG: hypothetical protein K2G45_06190 [Lachnospiraceae bacterium]|nr:hypothetical protein [Lachnospiraceae bacterium]